jgi:hypothetical protein
VHGIHSSSLLAPNNGTKLLSFKTKEVYFQPLHQLVGVGVQTAEASNSETFLRKNSTNLSE